MSDCIEWWAGVNEEGYGYTRAAGKQVRAHRHVYEVCYGPIPEGLMICHTCDNRSCVNPEHLYAGTHADNMRDMRERDRARGIIQTHCINGHEFTPENTGYENAAQCRGGRRRVCRKCAVAKSQRYQKR